MRRAPRSGVCRFRAQRHAGAATAAAVLVQVCLLRPAEDAAPQRMQRPVDVPAAAVYPRT
eukprot:201872-Chlamydomonas_euryale.AAC.8